MKIDKYILEHHSFFAVDPSIRACGWARLRKNKIKAGLCRSKEKDAALASIDIYRQLKKKCPARPGYLLIERPIIQSNWTQTKTGAIEKLLACYGACLALATENTRLWTPSVPQWKGQLSKEISFDRAAKLLAENGIKFEVEKSVPEGLQHNTNDAIALLTRYLQKERLIK
jgi:hypothetical protein